MQNKLHAFSQAAAYALVREINLTPKPGLVDRWDQGAHSDMDRQTFLKSVVALSPYFDRYIQIGYQQYEKAPQVLFAALRQAGQEAEAAMFQATKGVNTHKGINFLMAVLLGALGQYLANQPHLLDDPTLWTDHDSQKVCLACQPLTSHLADSDLMQIKKKDPATLSHGERLYLQHKITGPRGMVMSGFAPICNLALPFLRDQYQLGHPFVLVQLKTLLVLMGQIEDGNLIHRGGIQAWQAVKDQATSLLARPYSDIIDDLSHYNQILIQQRLSPGGAADLLAITIFLAMLEGIPSPYLKLLAP